MTDLENMDVMLSSYPRDNYEVQGKNSENEMDLRSSRQDQELNHNDGVFRSYLNNYLSENSSLTLEIGRAINSEISSQVSRQLEKLKSDLITQILDVINSAIDESIFHQ